jgi:hypothetical protein
MDTVENTMAFVGLTTPFSRFVAGFTIANAIVLTAKPSFAFDVDGNARGWRLTSNNHSATVTPWWVPGVTLGVVMATFV